MERINNSLAAALSTASRPSPATIPSSPLVPDNETAALLGRVIDRARSAIGWGRLPESEHDIWIVSWFEILHDAGVQPEQYDACYRAAQQRKFEQARQGQALSIVTPIDLCVELARVREMHTELDRTKLLPTNASAGCQRCFGRGFEEMIDGDVRPGCAHEPLTPAEIAARAKHHADMMAQTFAQAKAIAAAKAAAKVAAQETAPPVVKFACSSCGRRVNSVLGWQLDETCRAKIGGTSDAPELCAGTMQVRTRAA